MIGANNTTSEVDLDQIFNTLDGPTRKGLQNVFLGSAAQLKGAGAKAQAAFAYLNPAIASSSTLFNEIDRNTGQFTNFVVKTGSLVTDLAQRSTDLSGLVSHLSTTTAALASQRAALGSSHASAAGLHAPGQHDLRQPALGAERPDAAGQRDQAGRAQAAEAARPAAPAGHRLGPDRPRPVQHHPPARRQQRPDRADQAGRAAGRRHRAPRQRQRQDAHGDLPAVDRRAEQPPRPSWPPPAPTRSTSPAGSRASPIPARTTPTAAPAASLRSSASAPSPTAP